ncbi:MAG: U32 family peptidase [Candidatus Omnitrophota bacterium]|jgi:putative protease
MKIVAPISRAYEAECLIRAGADELYCGVYTEKWRKTYTDLAAPSRHPGRSASLGSFKELSRVVNTAHSRGIGVSFTMNESYSGRQYEFALDDASRAIDAGVDALIVSDINLMLMVREKGHKTRICSGTGANTFNSRTVDFYKELGVSRVILDRQLAIEEIGTIASKTSGVELEVFILNQKCHNIDGLCTFAHGFTGMKYPLLSFLWNTGLLKRVLNMCAADVSWMGKAIFKRELGCCLDYKISGNGDSLVPGKRTISSPLFDIDRFLKTCGACALYDLERLNIGFVKIVGREDFTSKKVRDIKFIRGAIERLKDGLAESAFKDAIKAMYKDTNHFDCGSRFCYYSN